jgi:hypothetical protein
MLEEVSQDRLSARAKKQRARRSRRDRFSLLRRRGLWEVAVIFMNMWGKGRRWARLQPERADGAESYLAGSVATTS